MSPQRAPVLAISATMTALALLLGGFAWLDREDDRNRQEQVAERGSLVMPFDLDATTHIFSPSSTGGVQMVVADDPDDVDQVALIRDHLRLEASKFRTGDFDDPAAIHGDEMPGIEALRERASEIDVTFRELPDGAELTYTATDPDLVDALHHWFDAQVSDHGSHAMSG